VIVCLDLVAPSPGAVFGVGRVARGARAAAGMAHGDAVTAPNFDGYTYWLHRQLGLSRFEPQVVTWLPSSLPALFGALRNKAMADQGME
jgi:hypothetical protein